MKFPVKLTHAHPDYVCTDMHELYKFYRTHTYAYSACTEEEFLKNPETYLKDTGYTIIR